MGLKIEVWLSWVERYVRDVEVASSNLVTSTKKQKERLARSFCFYGRGDKILNLNAR